MKLPKKTKKHQPSTQTEDKKKTLGLFDHVKQVTQIQSPDYFKNLSHEDKKSFNHFMILRAISMNPERLDDIALLYRYFSIIPSSSLYTLLITLLPPDRRYYPWIKSKKKYQYDQYLYDLVMKKFESSPKEAIEYVDILSRTEEGRNELFNICRGYGLMEREVEKLMKRNDENLKGE